MEGYSEEMVLEEELNYANSEEKKRRIKYMSDKQNKALEGNLNKILLMVRTLIEKLNETNDLTTLIKYSGHKGINFKYYFSEFKKDKSKGYIDNNFGQDLRNFRKYLEFARQHNSKTGFFNYG